MEEDFSADQSGNDNINSEGMTEPLSDSDPYNSDAYADPDTNEARDADGSSDPAPKDQDTVEIKTDKVSSRQTSTAPSSPQNMFNKPDAPKLLPAVERNILHNYRSWTYNWTLGALTPEAISNHALLDRDIKTFTVLDSTGKGTRGIGISTQGLNANKSDFAETKALLDGFNQNSPGRFDLYIDNISVDSIIGAGSPQGGSSIATNITFDVFEPLSMNGFIEALQVAGKAAGYSDYMKAAYALRVQFQGWPDNEDGRSTQSKPEVVPMSTRFFPITITEITVDVNEQGTRYRVNSVPVPQMGLGAPNKLTSDIKVTGDTVGEILKNFFDAINKMVEDRTKEQTRQPGRDRYEISCPKLSVPGNPQNTKSAILNNNTGTSFTSDIIKAKMNDELTSINVFKMADPAQTSSGYVGARVDGSTATSTTSNPSTGKITPKGGTVVFQAGAQIHDCIAAVIRDSSYTRELLHPENLDKVKRGDGLVTYFTVRMETDILGEDVVNNRRFQCYRYVVEPYQIHYTRIPGQEQGNIDLKNIKSKIKREYNYIYTGKNEDVLRFQLKFDNLYFTAIPAMMGNRGGATNAKAAAAGPDDLVDVKQDKSQAVVQGNNEGNSVPTAQRLVDPNQNDFEAQAKAGQVQADPYAKLAQNLHNAVLNSVDLIQGNLEILGDPYYLVTGGMGNRDLNLKEPLLTTDGQAPITQGDLYVSLNFRNPIDINSRTGLVDFGVAPISFSGVYRIISLKNNFKDGVFQQNLEIIRMPGQILGKEQEVLPSSGKTSPLPGQQLIKDAAPPDILKSGFRPSDFNLANLLSRGLPSPGLPGSLSNFTNALLGPAGGAATSSAESLLNQVAGVAGLAGALNNRIGTSPVSGIDALTSGVRLASSGLGSITSTPNTLAAPIAAAGLSIGSIAGIPDVAFKLGSNVSNAIASLPAAGISSVSGIAGQAVAGVTSLAQGATDLAKQGISAVSGVVGGARDKVAELFNPSPQTDLSAIGAKLGIDISSFSGLSPDQASKLTAELKNLSETIPENTDINSLREQGISFANISKEKLANLPVVQPKAVAPAALPDPAFAEIAQRFGSVNPLLNGRANLPNLTDINRVTNSLGTVGAGLSGSLNSPASLLNTVASAQGFVNNTIGSAVGLASNVGSITQNSIQGFSPASIGLGSVESNLTNVANITQVSAGSFNKIGISVTSQFGSLQSSPLAKLVSDNNLGTSV